MLDKATISNNYNLKNKEGVSLSLGNEEAEKIYNLVEKLGFNVAYYAGRRDPLNFDYKRPEFKKGKNRLCKRPLIN